MPPKKLEVGDYLTEAQLDKLDALIYRQSTGESMGLCPARVGYSLSEGFVQSTSQPMVWGTLMHSLIEAYVLASEEERAPLVLRHASPEYVLNVWRDVCTKEGFNLDEQAPLVHLQGWAEEACHAFSLWLDWWEGLGHNLHVYGVEVTRYRVIGFLADGRPVVLQGTADLVTMGGLWDWKTSGRAWEEGKAFTRQQSPLYVHLMEDVIGVQEGSVPFTFMVYDRKSARWQWITVDVTRVQVEAALAIAMERAKQIAAGAFPGTPSTESYGKLRRGWYCKPQYCGAWEICKFKGAIADGYNLDEKIPTSWV